MTKRAPSGPEALIKVVLPCKLTSAKVDNVTKASSKPKIVRVSAPNLIDVDTRNNLCIDDKRLVGISIEDPIP